ncbi:hypothetical protein NKH77_39085 [Streptomyces sp. M19]
MPAPLSPTRATTSPAWTSRCMSVSACTAPNRLEIPRNANTGPFGTMAISVLREGITLACSTGGATLPGWGS